MEIFSLKEHVSCYNYAKCIREGFSYYESSKTETDEGPHETDCILFVMEGELELSCNGERIKLPAGNMICCSRESMYRVFSQGKVSIVIAQFDNAVQSCEKVSFSQLNSLKKEYILLKSETGYTCSSNF